MHYFRILIFSFFLVFVLGCNRQPQSGYSMSSQESSDSSMPIYAKGFQIINIDGGLLIKIFDPWHKHKILQELYLYPEGNQPIKQIDNATTVTIPIQSIAITSLDNVGFLGELNALNRVVAITDVNRLFNSLLNKKVINNQVVDLGPAVDLNVEKLVVAQPDMVFSTTYNAGSKAKDIFLKSGMTVFLIWIGWSRPHWVGQSGLRWLAPY